MEELYLAGVRLEQFHSPASDPDPYYLEALRRDPGDSRANTALGMLSIRRGMFSEAEAYLRRAVARVTANYTAPKDSEPLYYLGVALKSLGKLDEAEKVLQRAAWAYAWQSPSFYLLAEIYSGKGDYPRALDMLSRSLVRNAWNTRALNLQTSLDRRLDLPVTYAAEKIQPLDLRVAIERAGSDVSKVAPLLKAYPTTGLEVAVEYGNAGLREEAAKVLKALIDAAPANSGVPVMAQYYLGYFDGAHASEHFAKAAALPVDYVFPFQMEAMAALRAALQANPKDAHAAYYLGNLLFDSQPGEAVKLWEQARALDPKNHILHRNLALAYARDEQQTGKAIASMETAISVKPDALHLYDLDRLYELAGASVEKRLAMLDRHLNVVRERDDVYSREIGLRVLAGDYDRAISMMANRYFHNWEGGARINVRDPWVDAHLLRGQQRLAQKDTAGALMDYQAALDAPENLESARSYRGGRTGEVLYRIGTAYEVAGQRAEAEKAWREAAALRSGTTDEDPHPRVDAGAAAFFYRAAAFAKLGERSKADAIWRELVEVGERASSRPEAADYFAKFGERQTPKQRSAMAFYVTGLGYAGLGQNEKARDAFERALALNPYLLDARTRLKAIGGNIRTSM